MSKILLVEDDTRIASFVKRGLEAEGYVVDLATTGEDGLALARDTPYALIVLDRMLPDANSMGWRSAACSVGSAMTVAS